MNIQTYNSGIISTMKQSTRLQLLNLHNLGFAFCTLACNLFGSA